MNEDGIYGTKSWEALNDLKTSFTSMGDAFDTWARQVELYSGSLDKLSDAAYELILNENGDDSVDDGFPTSLDKDMTDAEYYWHWMLRDAERG